jgi:hypothetical protein
METGYLLKRLLGFLIPVYYQPLLIPFNEERHIYCKYTQGHTLSNSNCNFGFAGLAPVYGCIFYASLNGNHASIRIA